MLRVKPFIWLKKKAMLLVAQQANLAGMSLVLKIMSPA